MAAHFVLLVLYAVLSNTRAESDASIWVDVPPPADNLEIEKRYTPEVIDELHAAQADALLLYTEYTAQAGSDLRNFIKNISQLTEETTRGMDRSILDNAPPSCRAEFERKLKKIEFDAHRAATFSGENHHKFFLGHMIVFRMHLNKSEEYIKKCDKIIKTCGTPCETTPRITRWRRLALTEIHRVRDDIQHSRRSYKDLLVHAHRKLNHFRKRATLRAHDAINTLQACVRHS